MSTGVYPTFALLLCNLLFCLLLRSLGEGLTLVLGECIQVKQICLDNG